VQYFHQKNKLNQRIFGGLFSCRLDTESTWSLKAVVWLSEIDSTWVHGVKIKCLTRVSTHD